MIDPATRRLIVEDYLRHDAPIKEIAARYNVSLASVTRILAQYRRTGSPDRNGPGPGRPRRVGPEAEALFARWACEDPQPTQAEMARRYVAEFGEPISQQTVSALLRKLGVNRGARRAGRRGASE